MSVRVMSRVWDCMPASGTKLLVMLALSDYAADDGSRAYPAVNTLATKVGCSPRQARRLLKELVAEGWLEILHRGGKSGKSKDTTEYRIVLEMLTEEREPAKDWEKGVSLTPPPGMSPTTGGGVTHVTPRVSPVSPEPSGEPPKNKGKKGDSLFGGGDDPFEGTVLDTPAFRAAWAEWMMYRRQRKLPKLVAVSIKKAAKELVSYGEAGARASIEQSIAKGWNGLFEPRGTFTAGGKAAAALDRPDDEAEQDWGQHTKEID